jgi:recombination protein RecT
MASQAEQSTNPVAVIRQNLNALAPEFKAALPPHISVEKFSRVAMTAVQNNPDLVAADRRSLFGAIVRLAQDGLLPDGREAALVLFGGKAQAMPMIGGILKRIRQSGEVAKVSAQVVHENDHFLVKYGFDEDVEHSPPALDQPRGKAIGAYATAVLKDGSRLLEVMSLEDIEKVRNVSRAKNNGPWVGWWGEMARKTVMRRLSKRLPMSTDLEEQIFSRDETLSVDGRAFEAANQQEQLPAPTSRLDAIEAGIGGEVVDMVTGEISDPVAQEAIEAQVEEIEAKVDDAPATLLDTIDATPAEPTDKDPAASKANALIDEIKAAISTMDIDGIIARETVHIDAMPEGLASMVRQVAEVRKSEITAEREKAKEAAE